MTKAFHAGAPELMQALLLRLQTQMWQHTGHGFNTVRDALLGAGELVLKEQRDSLLIELAKAACIRDVSRRDCGKGLQLVNGIEVRALLRVLDVLIFGDLCHLDARNVWP